MPDNDHLAADGKLKRKEYERELARLHVEFVKLQPWVVHKGLKPDAEAARPCLGLSANR